MATKLYKNTSKQKMIVLGLGEIPAGGQVSVSGEHLPVVIVENYPGLVDVTAADETEAQAKANKAGK